MGKEKQEPVEVEEVVSKPASGGRKHPKVSRLTLAQIDVELEKVQKNMGGLTSKHAQFLLEQRHFLTQSAPRQAPLKKAA